MATKFFVLTLIGFSLIIFGPQPEPVTGVTTYVIPPISDTKVLPSSPISHNYISNQISIAASPGEYESASFVIQSQQDIPSLLIQPTDLVGTTGILPSGNIDIRVVKSWYQGAYDLDVGYHGVYLTPELLLKDDSLVKVEGTAWDNPGGNNYLKLTSGKYVLISQRNDTEYGPAVIPLTERPIRDAPALQPANIHKGLNKQFWITVKVPDTAKAGTYNAEIRLLTGPRLIGRLQLKLQVLPIQLARPYLTYSIYYRGQLKDAGSISSEEKDQTQFTAEMNDLFSHGISNPTVYTADSLSRLEDILSIRDSIGLSNQPLFFLDSPEIYDVQSFNNLVHSFGITEIYLYGVDEGSAEENIAAIDAIHDRGYKAFVAINNSTAAASVASSLDILVRSGAPNASLAATYHNYGHKVFSYANPQVGPEYPRTFRLNYGLLLWQKDYDGAMDYAYQHSYGDIWNDFDSAEDYRDHVFAYPTMNGVIGTVQWEGYREGVDDVRYLTTLRNTIQTAKAAGKDTSAAEAWLADLKASDLAAQNLDAIRAQMVNYLLGLK